VSEERRTYSYHGRNKGGGGGGGGKMAEEESKWSQGYQSGVKCIKVESRVSKQSQVYTSQVYQKEKAQEHLHVDVESVEPAL